MSHQNQPNQNDDPSPEGVSVFGFTTDPNEIERAFKEVDEDADLEDDRTKDDSLEDLDDLTDVHLACDEDVEDMMQNLLDIQHELNVKFLGEDWITKAQNHAEVDYCPALLDEATELMRSCGRWKFWKNEVQEDHENMRLEFIDILHFALSEGLASRFSRFNIAKNMGFWYEQVYQSTDIVPRYDYLGMKKALMSFLASAFTVHIGDAEAEDLVSDLEVQSSQSLLSSSVAGLDWEAFWAIPFNLGMSFEDVYLTYIAKVSLNEFRVSNGYKEGTYKKEWWDGQEDNFHLMKAIREAAENAEFGDRLPTKDEIMDWIFISYHAFNEGRRPIPLEPI